MAKNQVSEADCWFVIGAHQAGATERQCAEMAGLTKTATHNIIANFKKLGSPHAASIVSASTLQPAESRKRKADYAGSDARATRTTTLGPQTKRKRGRPRKPKASLITEALVHETLLHASPCIEIPKGVMCAEQNITVDSMPCHGEQSKGKEAENQDSITEDTLPPRTRSSMIDDRSMDEWTAKDDQILLAHVFDEQPSSKVWKELENVLGSQHLAQTCCDRWDFLKRRLLKDLAGESERRNVKENDTQPH